MTSEKWIPVAHDEAVGVTHSGCQTRLDFIYIPDSTNAEYVLLYKEHVEALIKALQEAIK